MTEHKVGTREEWLEARNALLEREKELTRRGDELARERRELPLVRVEKEYSFETEDGPRTLAELFEGRSQLLVYNFMVGPDYTAGCPVCSSGADTYTGAVAHLHARDVTFFCISRAPLERLQAYKRRMGWSFPWASSHGSDFNFDFGASHTQEELAPLLGGNLGPVPALAADCGTDPAGYLSEGRSSARSHSRTGSSTTRTRPPPAASNSCSGTTRSSTGRPAGATRASRPSCGSTATTSTSTGRVDSRLTYSYMGI
jgi:predicted dithiol-disulfide oxidoreductase (DUF899 family)